MLGNCEKMVLISSYTNEWPQNQLNEKGSMMEKPGQAQQQQPLRCPRCDSTNTKFCYYNNYSLSQPRHFCKACKRYWTRGGTLRNVPVGGGCRKNKRVKKSSSAIDGVSSSSSSPFSANLIPPAQTQTDLSSTSNRMMNSPLFGLHGNPSELNLPFSMVNTRVSNVDGTFSGYDLQPQFNSLGLGFSSANAFDFSSKNIQDLLSSKSLLTSHPIFGSSSSSSSSSTTMNPTMGSLLASTLQQQRFINLGVKEAREPNKFQIFGNQTAAYSNEAMEVKLEGLYRMEGSDPCQNRVEQTGLSDPSFFWNAATNVGSWHDPANFGSSVPSLI